MTDEDCDDTNERAQFITTTDTNCDGIYDVELSQLVLIVVVLTPMVVFIVGEVIIIAKSVTHQVEHLLRFLQEIRRTVLSIQMGMFIVGEDGMLPAQTPPPSGTLFKYQQVLSTVVA